jgi:hypothetical protein
MAGQTNGAPVMLIGAVCHIPNSSKFFLIVAAGFVASFPGASIAFADFDKPGNKLEDKIGLFDQIMAGLCQR